MLSLGMNARKGLLIVQEIKASGVTRYLALNEEETESLFFYLINNKPELVLNIKDDILKKTIHEATKE